MLNYIKPQELNNRYGEYFLMFRNDKVPMEDRIKRVYAVDFVYAVDDDKYMCIERYAFIGVFSTLEKANAAIEELMLQPGFKDHSRECFVVSIEELNKLQEWMTGFVRFD